MNKMNIEKRERDSKLVDILTALLLMLTLVATPLSSAYAADNNSDTILTLPVLEEAEAISPDAVELENLSVNFTYVNDSGQLNGSVSYRLIEDTYTLGEILTAPNGNLIREVTIYPEQYLQLFNDEGTFNIVPANQVATVNMYWDSKSKQWLLEQSQVEFTVKYDSNSLPATPTHKQLSVLLEAMIVVYNEEEGAMCIMSLIPDSYVIGSVELSDSGKYTVDINIEPEKYLEDFASTFGYSNVSSDELGVITLEWNQENQDWELGYDSSLVTFEANLKDYNSLPALPTEPSIDENEPIVTNPSVPCDDDSTSATIAKTDVPQTGDDSLVAPFVITLIVSISGLMLVLLLRIRSKSLTKR